MAEEVGLALRHLDWHLGEIRRGNGQEWYSY